MDNPSGNFAFWNGNLIFFFPWAVLSDSNNVKLTTPPFIQDHNNFPKTRVKWNAHSSFSCCYSVFFEVCYCLFKFSFFFFFSSKYCLTNLCPDSEIIYIIPDPFNGLRDRKGTPRYSKIGCRPKMMIHSFSHAVHCIPPWPSVLLLTLMQWLSKNSGVIQPRGIPYGLLQLKSWQRETSLLVGS